MRQKGYSLIELLVVMAIFALFLQAGYIGYQEFTRRQKVAGAVRLVEADLRIAQEYALSGTKPEGFNCPRPDYYEGVLVTFISSNRYSISARCSSGRNFPFRTAELPSGISFRILPSTTSILFKSVTGGTDISGTVNINICENNVGNAIEITSSGKITKTDNVNCN